MVGQMSLQDIISRREGSDYNRYAFKAEWSWELDLALYINE